MRPMWGLCLVGVVRTVLAEVAGNWNYDRCDLANGPSHWPGKESSAFCDGAEQSPIDVCGAIESADAGNLSFAWGYRSMQPLKFSSDGRAYIDASGGYGLTLDAGGLVRSCALLAWLSP